MSRLRALDPEKDKRPLGAHKLVANALAFWGDPTISGRMRSALVGFAERAFEDADEHWKRDAYPALIENALRQLVAVSPDSQTC